MTNHNPTLLTRADARAKALRATCSWFRDPAVGLMMPFVRSRYSERWRDQPVCVGSSDAPSWDRGRCDLRPDTGTVAPNSRASRAAVPLADHLSGRSSRTAGCVVVGALVRDAYASRRHPAVQLPVVLHAFDAVVIEVPFDELSLLRNDEKMPSAAFAQ